MLRDVFAGLVGKKVIGPSQSFNSASGQSAIKCSQKANEALLYPLEKAFLCIPKPTLYLPYADISKLVFARVTSAAANTTKTFEVKISNRNGSDVTFSSISRDEYKSLELFCRSKKLNVRSEVDEDTGTFIGSSGDDKKRSKPDYHDDFDTESDDEDFRADAGSGSDIAEEFNEDYGGTSASDNDAAKASEDDNDDNDDNDEPVEKILTKKTGKNKDSDGPPPKKRAKKDPNAPKRGLSSYIFFSNAQRASVLVDNPGMGIGDVAKILGARWKALADSDKSVIYFLFSNMKSWPSLTRLDMPGKC